MPARLVRKNMSRFTPNNRAYGVTLFVFGARALRACVSLSGATRSNGNLSDGPHNERHRQLKLSNGFAEISPERERRGAVRAATREVNVQTA